MIGSSGLVGPAAQWSAEGRASRQNTAPMQISAFTEHLAFAACLAALLGTAAVSPAQAALFDREIAFSEAEIQHSLSRYFLRFPSRFPTLLLYFLLKTETNKRIVFVTVEIFRIDTYHYP